MNVSGPWPSDTVFLKAKRGEVDAVVTMYHDQGQIAIKLLGFERGVTVAGGLPLPIATPAHGTAFDIAGQNKANVSAIRQAFNLLLRMAKTHREVSEKMV
jgi:4-hydroxythreonine-4-phosphate dehydrogenase